VKCESWIYTHTHTHTHTRRWSFPTLLTMQSLHLTFDPYPVTSCHTTRLERAWRDTSVCVFSTAADTLSLSQSVPSKTPSPSPLHPVHTRSSSPIHKQQQQIQPNPPPPPFLPLAIREVQLIAPRWERVAGAKGEGGSVLREGRKWRGGGGGFSILLWYFSVCRSFFPFLSLCPPLAPWMETRLSRLSGDRQYGPDNGPQSEVVVVEGERGREREREGEKGRPGQGHRGREGQNGALVCKARTLHSITLLASSLPPSLSLSLSLSHTHTHTHTKTHTYTHTPCPQTHTPR